MKTACITGVTGQTGSYLTELLLKEGYKVYGLIRRSSNFNTQRIDHIYKDPHISKDLELVYGDLADYSSIVGFVSDAKPDLFFNMACQSHVRISFDIPEYTMDIACTGVIRCLEAIRKYSPKTRFLQASTSVIGDTNVLVKKSDNIKLVKIEDLVYNNDQKTYYSDLKCLTIDDNFNVKWSDVAYVFKHKSNNIFNLKGSGGLDITLTGDHSVMILDDQANIIEKKVEELNENDFLLSFVKNDSKGYYPEFNLSNYSYNKKYADNRSNPSIQNIKINNDILRFLGYYLAEGNIYIKKNKNYDITLTFHINETNYTKDIKNIIKENFGINNFYEPEIVDRNTRRIRFSSKPLAYFIMEHFKTGSYNKRIPNWMFNLPKDGVVEFLRGYIGDAKIDNNEITYTSCNKSIIESLCYLSKLNGFDCCIVERENKDHLSPQNTIIKGCKCYDLQFRSKFSDYIQNKIIDRAKYKKCNADLIPKDVYNNFIMGTKYKKCNKKSISKKRVLKIIGSDTNINDKLKNLCNSDVHIVRIKNIEKLNSDSIDVYDLHVPETQRFIGGNYPILLHNSEMFGTSPAPQNEQTPFQPQSPYACGKVGAFYTTVNYRKAYNLFAVSSITFNHESVRRTPNFVTRKITRAATRIKMGLQDKLYLGNLDAKRDWSYAGDVVKGMYKIITAPEPKDYVIATGETRSVKEFLETVFNKLNLDWKEYVEFDKRYLRPTEVPELCGDASKIKKDLGWEPEYTFDDLVQSMIDHDLELATQEKALSFNFMEGSFEKDTS